MALLEARKRFLILLDGGFQLLDVFCSSFSESGLRLSVSLLSLLGRSVDLADDVSSANRRVVL